MEVQDSSSIASYDNIHYTSAPYPETHPNRLATIAMIFGMQPAPVTNCRVLELGCSSGENLIGAAFGLPQSEFLGIDLSKNEVALANKTIDALGLTNIKIKHSNIMDITNDVGKFDYIIAHGVYSWVPDEVKARVLQLCRELLRPNGVALVSYNTFPGWHIHQIARDIMLYRTRNMTDKIAATKVAREFYTKIVSAISPKNAIYKAVMENDYERTSAFPDSYVSHDTLEEINNPFYFYQFMEAAKKEKLQYLGDAVFHSMIANEVTAPAITLLKNAGPDIIDTEQCLDFINNRLFRSTLLCHENVELTRGFNPEILKQFYFAAPLQAHPLSEDLLDNNKITFKPIVGPDLFTDDPVAKVLLSYLSVEWPKPVSVVEITNHLQKTIKSSPKEIAQQALQYLWRFYTIGLLRLFIHPLPITNIVSAKPKTTALIRYQAEHRFPCLTNQLHDEITLTPLQHHLLPKLDGEHDHDALLNIMIDLVHRKKINLQKAGAQITDSAKMKLALKELLESALGDWAKLGLLIE